MTKKKILAVIMARSGSKGLKNKNIKKINNVPLLILPSLITRKIKAITKTIISTDSVAYGKLAKKNGIGFFFIRTKKLSGPKVPDHLVLKDALIKAEKFYKIKFDAVISLPPTSPLRNKKDLEKSINKFNLKNYDSLWTVSKVDLKYHPEKQLKIKNNKISYYSKTGDQIHYRQQLKSTFYRNGCAYIISRKILLENKNGLMTKNSTFFITKNEQISIDTLDDLKFARKKFKFSLYK